MKKKVVLVINCLLLMVLCGCFSSGLSGDDEKNSQELRSKYLDDNLPINEVKLFSEDLISLEDRLESKIVFSPDGKTVYLHVYTEDYQSRILYSKNVDGEWSEFEETSFSIGSNMNLSSVSPDGKYLYVHSNNRTNSDIYMVEIQESGFGELTILPEPINSTQSDRDLVVLENGDMYINSKRTGSESSDNWTVTEDSNGEYVIEKVENINSTGVDSGLCFSNDGSYMIFGSDRLGKAGHAHLYISFKDETGNWTNPINLNDSGLVINDDRYHQGKPSLSPDGKFLFFMRHLDFDTMDIYWINTDFVDDLRVIVFDS